MLAVYWTTKLGGGGPHSTLIQPSFNPHSSPASPGPGGTAAAPQRALVGFQASARGGVVRVELRGERVALVGRVTTTLVGRVVDAPIERHVAGKAGAFLAP